MKKKVPSYRSVGKGATRKNRLSRDATPRPMRSRTAGRAKGKVTAPMSTPVFTETSIPSLIASAVSRASGLEPNWADSTNFLTMSKTWLSARNNIAPPSKQKAPSAALKGEALMMEGTAGVNRGCPPVRSMSNPAAITRRSCGGLLS